MSGAAKEDDAENLFDNVFAEPTPRLARQREAVRQEAGVEK